MQEVNVSMITIPLQEYLKLMNDSEFLTCLRAAGVDNWSGYEYAIDMFNDGNKDD